jgi:predicted membrane protein
MMKPAKKPYYTLVELLGYVALVVGVVMGLNLSYYPYSHNPNASSSVLVPMFVGIALLGFVVSFVYVPFLRRRDQARKSP